MLSFVEMPQANHQQEAVTIPVTAFLLYVGK